MVQWGVDSKVVEIYWRILGLFGREVRGFGGFVPRGFMSSEVYWEGGVIGSNARDAKAFRGSKLLLSSPATENSE